ARSSATRSTPARASSRSSARATAPGRRADSGAGGERGFTLQQNRPKFKLWTKTPPSIQCFKFVPEPGCWGATPTPNHHGIDRVQAALDSLLVFLLVLTSQLLKLILRDRFRLGVDELAFIEDQRHSIEELL